MKCAFLTLMRGQDSSIKEVSEPLHLVLWYQWNGCPPKTLFNTVEPLNKGHIGVNSFVRYREVVPISEVK